MADFKIVNSLMRIAVAPPLRPPAQAVLKMTKKGDHLSPSKELQIPLYVRASTSKRHPSTALPSPVAAKTTTSPPKIFHQTELASKSTLTRKLLPQKRRDRRTAKRCRGSPKTSLHSQKINFNCQILPARVTHSLVAKDLEDPAETRLLSTLNFRRAAITTFVSISPQNLIYP